MEYIYVYIYIIYIYERVVFMSVEYNYIGWMLGRVKMDNDRIYL